MTKLEYALALAGLILSVVAAYMYGYSEGKAVGRKVCPAAVGQEVVATTPTACMYADRAKRVVYRRSI